MKEFVEKLKVRLKKCSFSIDDSSHTIDIDVVDYNDAVEIIDELAEEHKPKTNADIIRSMSDEELADYIILVGYDYIEKIPYCKNTPQCTEILDDGRIIPEEMCRGCLIKWLKSKTE